MDTIFCHSCGRRKGILSFTRDFRSTTGKLNCNTCGEKVVRRVNKDKRMRIEKEIAHSTAFMDINAVKRMIGFKSTASIYTLMNEQGFPRPIAIGVRTKRWVSSEVEEWVREKIEESRR